MKKILLTNNSIFIDDNYDKVFTDSPFIVEKYNYAIYLDTLLDKSLDELINKTRKKGYETNKKIIDTFFPNYKNRNINILDIQGEFTNIFINIVKLCKLMELYPNDEITIKVTKDELYNYENSNVLDRFVNVYYWISELNKIKNIKLICKNIMRENLNRDHLPIKSWFLRLIDLDKKVFLFNFLKKLNLLKNSKQQIYLYKKNTMIREIEPYLYDLGFDLINMPEIQFNYKKSANISTDENIKIILNQFFENNFLNNIFKKSLLEMYKKKIDYYIQREEYTHEYISKLNNSIKFIVSNTINGFDSHIFAKQLQKKGFKIINIMHGFSTSFRRKEDLDFYECQAPNLTLCFNQSEKTFYNNLVKSSVLKPISIMQEAKKKRFKFIKRIHVNKMLNINEKVNIFYPSILYPYNNVTIYGYRQSDKSIYEFERKIILLLSNVNKRVIYKNYPKEAYIDKNSIINYAKNFRNIVTINENYDFRYVSSIGDIFILTMIGASSTVTWMLGENRPIIFLYTNKSIFISAKGKKILEKIFILIDIDKDNWTQKLSSILNKPFEEILKIWDAKKIYRDLFDEEWLMGTKLHAGKLGSKYIQKFILENTK